MTQAQQTAAEQEAADKKGAGIIHDDTSSIECGPRFDSNGP